jgi:hypothetical protein
MNDIPQDDEESLDTVEDLFADFDKKELEWKHKHPFRAYIKDWLDERFPSGIAGGYRAYYALLRPWKILRYIKYEIKYAWQRVFRGWDDKATWNLNYYLANIIPQILKELKKGKMGIPIPCFEGLPY